MNPPRSGVFVFFGATGDLAYKKIFRALQSMIRRGHLDVPIIGVAKAGWTVDQLRERARASLNEHGGGVDAAAFSMLADRLHYVDGDYNDSAVFDQLRREIASSPCPLHYRPSPSSPLDGGTISASG